MSGQFAPIAVDLGQVRKAVGSKSRSLLPALQQRFGPWFDDVNEQVADRDEGDPSLEEVLKRLIAGQPVSANWPFQFAGRVEMCMGYLLLAEVRSAMEAFARANYAPLQPDVRLAVAEVRSWLVSCDTLGRDLAGFYSG